MALLRPPEQLTAAYMARMARLRRASVLSIQALFDDVVTGPESAAAFVDAAVPVVLGAQQAVVAEVDAYLSTAAGAMTRTSTAPVGLDASQLIGAKARNGTSIETVYSRPFWQWERRQAELFDEALQRLPRGSIRRQSSLIARERIRLYARTRVAQDIVTDMQLVQRDAAWARVQIDPRLPRWRRVLSGAENCPLCAVAATNTYAKIRRIQLHPRCDCGIEPVVDTDVMATPLVRDLPDVYRRMADMRIRGSGISKRTDTTGPVTLYPDLLNARFEPGALPGVEVVEHGELGPTLWVQGQHFTGPESI